MPVRENLVCTLTPVAVFFVDTDHDGDGDR